MGVVAASMNDIKPAKDIIDCMVGKACLRVGSGYTRGKESKLRKVERQLD